ncbi:MAG: hypothetical protein ABSA14_06550 [Acidimicrobiales bacterium]
MTGKPSQRHNRGLHAVIVMTAPGRQRRERPYRPFLTLLCIDSVDAGYRVGIPVLGVTAVAAELVRDERYLGLATRTCAELWADRSDPLLRRFRAVDPRLPCGDGHRRWEETPLAGCSHDGVPAIEVGVSPAYMGRNVFQSGSPVAMIQAIGKVAPEALKPEDAFQAYQELAHELGRGGQ